MMLARPALEMGRATSIVFVRRYPSNAARKPPLSLRQVDPLIRETGALP